MGISVGAALKKIAVALVLDKKTLKNIAMAALVIIVALLMPMAAIIAVFSGTLELDVAALQEQIAEEMSDSDRQMLQQVEPFAKSIPMQAFRTLTHHSGYADHIRTGRYAIHPGDGAFKVWRHLKNGLQEPMNLTVPSVRTIDKLSAELSKKLMLDSLEIRKALTDEATCEKYGYDTAHLYILVVGSVIYIQGTLAHSVTTHNSVHSTIYIIG